MEQSWLTYREAADALKLRSADAAKLRAKRGRWPKRIGNDGLARVQVPEITTPVRSQVDPGSTPDRSGVDPASIPLVDPALVTALEAHVETLKADVDKLEAQLAHERARADKAIEAFAALAERLDALAAARARPWWRRFVG